MEKEADILLLNDLGKDIIELVNRGKRGTYSTFAKRIEEAKQSG
jgi:hypothetical protein